MPTELVCTPIDNIPQVHADLRKSFRAGKLKSIEARKTQILQLAYLLQDNYDRFKVTFARDLGRPPLEVAFLELQLTMKDCKIAYDRVDKWARTEKAALNANSAAFRPVIRKEPKGVVLSFSPFNYPVWLAFGPMVCHYYLFVFPAFHLHALMYHRSAPSRRALKPSELSPATGGLIAELIPKYMDPDVVRVVLGSAPVMTKLLELPWDHRSGRQTAMEVCAAAAKTLSPVSLELGGKSPVVIDPRCDLQTAARRILWGKCVNAGQTCIAPDYILVQEDAQDTIIEQLKKAHDEIYPDGTIGSPDLCHIVNKEHFDRINGLLERTSGKIVLGGQTDEPKLFIAPKIIKGVKGDDSLMSEGLFGPLLPIVPVKDLDEAIEFINDREYPLALYVFSQDPSFKNKVFDNTQSGAAIANDTLIHCAADGLPFGGIGPSGNGYFMRKYTFEIVNRLTFLG